MKLAEFYDASTHEKVFINPEHVVGLLAPTNTP